MTVIQKTIGRLPVNLGDYDSTKSYGKKNRVNLYGCEWESKIENNTYPPATLVEGVVTPDTTHWRLNSGVPGNYGLDQKVADLQTAVGTGGSVDSRIASAKSEIKGNATSACDTLGKAEGLISYEKSRAQASEQQLQEQYNALTQSDIIIGDLPASGTKNKIYRVPGTTSYSDYMWNGSSFVLMATYDNAIDAVPTSGSNNLVKSGGVFADEVEMLIMAQKTNPMSVFIPYDISWAFWHACKIDQLIGCLLIPVTNGDVVEVFSTSMYYAVLKSIDTMKTVGAADFATGYSDRVNASNYLRCVVPSDGKYFYLWRLDKDAYPAYYPADIKVNGVSIFVDTEKKELRNTANSLLSCPSSIMRQTADGVIKFAVDKWLHNLTNCTLRFCFARPSDIFTTVFLMAWDSAGGFCYLFVSHNTIVLRLNGSTQVDAFAIDSYSAGEKILFEIAKRGNRADFFINGVNVRAGVTFPSVSAPTSDVFIGSWIDETNKAVTDYYFVEMVDDSTHEVVQIQNAGSVFTKYTAQKVMLGKVFQGNSSTGSVLTDGDVIITGEITLNKTITLDENTHLRGNDCIIHVGSNGKLVLTDGCSIDGFTFDGGLEYTRVKQEGIAYYNLVPLISENDIPNWASYIGSEVVSILGENATITNCRFDNIDRLCIKYNDNNQAYLVKTQPDIINNYFFNCRAGILYQGEFGRIIGNVFNSVVYGCVLSHGNLTMSSCIFLRDDVGMLIVGGGNPGHSEFNGLEYAHCGIAGTYILALPRSVGNVFSGCHWADAPIIGVVCNALLITGSRVDTWVEIASGDVNAFVGNLVYKTYVTSRGKTNIFGGAVTYILKNNIPGTAGIDSEINN